jgi:hypothetical protein
MCGGIANPADEDRDYILNIAEALPQMNYFAEFHPSVFRFHRGERGGYWNNRISSGSTISV